jgi:hypothetical protein
MKSIHTFTLHVLDSNFDEELEHILTTIAKILNEESKKKQDDDKLVRNHAVTALQFIVHHLMQYTMSQLTASLNMMPLQLFLSCPTEKTLTCLSGPQVSNEQTILVKIHCITGQEKSTDQKTRTICQWAIEE